MGPIENQLRSKITDALLPQHLEIDNESHTHSVPANSETHFRAVVVSQKFEGMSRVARQRAVMEVIGSEIKAGVHAFTMRCLTPDEWSRQSTTGFASPPCHGGSKSSQK